MRANRERRAADGPPSVAGRVALTGVAAQRALTPCASGRRIGGRVGQSIRPAMLSARTTGVVESAGYLASARYLAVRERMRSSNDASDDEDEWKAPATCGRPHRGRAGWCALCWEHCTPDREHCTPDREHCRRHHVA